MAMNIFCVDDRSFHLKRSRELVEKVCETNSIADAKIYECTNGRELIEQARNHPPALVMLDINMPELDGLTTLVKFRSIYPGYKTKIVMVSSENQRVVKRLAATNLAKPAEDAKKRELLSKVIDRVRTGAQEAGKINSVLEACASLEMDPVQVAKENGANGFISKPFEIESTSAKLAEFI